MFTLSPFSSNLTSRLIFTLSRNSCFLRIIKHTPTTHAPTTCLSSVQFTSGAQSWLTLHDPMDCSTPGFPVHYQLPESIQTPNPCPLSRGCHPTTSSSVAPVSSCLKSFSASGSFQMSQLFESGGQNIGVSASTSVLPMNIQD